MQVRSLLIFTYASYPFVHQVISFRILDKIIATMLHHREAAERDTRSLVDLDVPLLGLLEPLDPLVVVDSLLLANSREHFLNSRHHSLESAEVHVRAVLELVEDLVGVLLDLVLDVHLSPLLVLLLAREAH